MVAIYKLVGRVTVQLTATEINDDIYDIVKTIECTDISGDVFVSTIFLSSTARKDAAGMPLLFETMIIGGEHDGYQRRYATYGDAEKGHQETIEMLFEI